MGTIKVFIGGDLVGSALVAEERPMGKETAGFPKPYGKYIHDRKGLYDGPRENIEYENILEFLKEQRIFSVEYEMSASRVVFLEECDQAFAVTFSKESFQRLINELLEIYIKMPDHADTTI